MILGLSTFLLPTGTHCPQAQREANSRSSQVRRPSCYRMTYVLNGLAVLALFLLCNLFLAKSSTIAITIAKGTTANTMNNAIISSSHTSISHPSLLPQCIWVNWGPYMCDWQYSPAVWLGHLATSVKQYRENLYQILLSLSKALCNHSPVQADILVTNPKQNIFALSLLQHICMNRNCLEHCICSKHAIIHTINLSQ